MKEKFKEFFGKTKQERRKNVIDLVAFLIGFVGLIIIWKTIFFMIPALYILITIITESQILIDNAFKFIKIWSIANVFLITGILLYLANRIKIKWKKK